MYASMWKGTCTLLGIDANSICKEENATLFQDKVRMSCMTSKKKCQACAVEDLNKGTRNSQIPIIYRIKHNLKHKFLMIISKHPTAENVIQEKLIQQHFKVDLTAT